MPEGSASLASPVGQRWRRHEDARLVRGAGRFVADIALPNMAHAVVMRSQHPHADILGIDTAAALRVPGVVTVLTGAELAADGIGGIPWEVRPPGADPSLPEGDPRIAPPQPALAQGRVRYVGEPVALVVAETLAAAHDGAEAVQVAYAALPAVSSAVAALAFGAPPLRPEIAAGNLLYTVRKGDEAATATAFVRAAHVVTVAVTNQRLAAAPIEPRAYLGEHDASSGRWTLTANAGKPHPIRDTLARFVFRVPPRQIRVVAPDIGGGFGAKNVLYPEEILVLWAAQRLGRPVRWVQERSETFLSDMQGRGQVNQAELALDAKGNALALRVRSVADLGAWLGPRAVVPTISGLKLYGSVYRIGAVQAEVRAGFSNTVPTCPYRGAGHPEAIYVVERLMEAAARRLGRDPVDLRRQNLIAPEQLPWRAAVGVTYDTGDYPAAMVRALELAAHADFAARRAAAQARGRLLGIGVANCIEQCGSGYDEGAELLAEPDGGVTILIGTKSSGQSHETAYAQVAAAVLGLSPARIRVVQGDTDRIARGNGTGACRSLTTGGSAVLRGAEALVEAGRRRASRHFEADATDILYAEGSYRVAGTDRVVTLAGLAASEPLSASARFAPVDGTWPAGCHVAELEIDPETGEVRLLRYAFAHDVGRAVNPMVVLGQMQGGLAQGIGQAMFEHVAIDPDSAQVLAGSFMDYAMPRAADLPCFDGALLAAPTALNPLGAKAVGEAGPTAAPPAIIAAVLDALAPLGVRHIDMPATPARVWQAIRDARG